MPSWRRVTGAAAALPRPRPSGTRTARAREIATRAPEGAAAAVSATGETAAPTLAAEATSAMVPAKGSPASVETSTTPTVRTSTAAMTAAVLRKYGGCETNKTQGDESGEKGMEHGPFHDAPSTAEPGWQATAGVNPN